MPEVCETAGARHAAARAQDLPADAGYETPVAEPTLFDALEDAKSSDEQ